VQAGTPLTITLVWQNLEGFPQSQTVFVHLVDPREQTRGQGDALPAQGTRPTPSWLPGEILLDTHSVAVPADAPPGAGYTLRVGFYQPETGKRIPVRLTTTSTGTPVVM